MDGRSLNCWNSKEKVEGFVGKGDHSSYTSRERVRAREGRNRVKEEEERRKRKRRLGCVEDGHGNEY